MLDGSVLSKTLLLGTSREQICATFLFLAAVDGAVALLGWFSSMQGSAVWAEPCTGPASPSHVSQDTTSLSQLFVSWQMELAWSKVSPGSPEQAWWQLVPQLRTTFLPWDATET